VCCSLRHHSPGEKPLGQRQIVGYAPRTLQLIGSAARLSVLHARNLPVQRVGQVLSSTTDGSPFVLLVEHHAHTRELRAPAFNTFDAPDAARALIRVTTTRPAVIAA
jgi:hypothetical protein